MGVSRAGEIHMGKYPGRKPGDFYPPRLAMGIFVTRVVDYTIAVVFLTYWVISVIICPMMSLCEMLSL
ncbi:MAG: hypothetical protein A3F10_07275 [Coxiella sp. RIFCSPHIGHO2_12_FULL_42_15]|nr:MAG: hypothetical protein A3F10_07275 [Coxiella sp. RIFCSPHIGHO2_12_FULL_42_15]